ncbi:MAG: hypothetical protein KAT15_11055 [Bacteroidales bacterium]|nr:hypothetical protein [Bacteroidales bacterium]
MDSSDIIRLLSADHYAPADLEEVSDVCRNYPMFNLAHMLKVRIREVLGNDKKAELKLAAVYSSDRKKLHQLVTEVVKSQFPEEEVIPEETGGIQFSDEPHQEAEVIIEQHAPYAVADAGDDLLELDEDEPEDSFIVEQDTDDTGPEVEMSSETLIQAMVKEETDMEEAGPERLETPVIDVVKPAQENSDHNNLIKNFIEDEPGPIRADRKIGLKGDVSLASIMEHDGFITDTLARIYVKQGLYAKAIYAYEKLSLKYPEKSAYFAAQIEKIRNINYS